MEHDNGSWLFAELHPPLTPEQATVEASACLQCGGPLAPAPCTVACPAGVDVPTFIRQIAAGLPIDAARTILDANILGGTCGRVCPVEELCQGACVMEKRGRRAIQIGRLQRFATDALETGELENPPAAPPAPTGPSIGVIGAGPAGLACAAELARLGYRVTVYEKRPLAGGMVVQGIAPYKQVVDPIPAEVDRIARLGVEFRYEVEIGRDITPDDLRDRHAALFLGVGMGADTPSKIPGEDLPGVWESLDFIDKAKSGAARRLHLGQRLAVIGGGNTAIDVAREAVRLGIPEVTLIYRREQTQMPAYKHEIEAAQREGVKLLCQAAPLGFLGHARVHAIRCIRMGPGEPDASGRPRPVPIEGSEFELAADTVVKAIGQQAHTRLFQLFGLELRSGNVKTNQDLRTSDETTFAGGDCTNGGATVVEAVRDGKAAAHAIHRALLQLPRAPEPGAPPVLVTKRGEVISHLQGTYELATSPVLCKGCSLCVESCPASVLHLDQASKIAVADANTCVFCGICEDRCPDFAIWIHKGEPIRRSSSPRQEAHA